jgi:hypothetical protein
MPVRLKPRSPEHPEALLHHTGSQDGLHTGDADGPFLRRSDDGICAPNWHGGEERAGDARDVQARGVFVWRVFSPPFSA